MAADMQTELARILDDVLVLNGRGITLRADSRLMGAIPELDSMAVVTLITSLEERFGITIDDDDIDGATFGSVGSLVDFVAAKLG
jgi:acyl carrier protein